MIVKRSMSKTTASIFQLKDSKRLDILKTSGILGNVFLIANHITRKISNSPKYSSLGRCEQVFKKYM